MKKNYVKGIACIALILAMALAACSQPSGGGGDSGAPLPVAPAATLEEMLRKYMGPKEEKWGDDGSRSTKVYYLDPSRYAAFKAELDAGGEYAQYEDWTDPNRNWERGQTFARFSIRPNGTVQVDLNKADNTETGARYNKTTSASLGPKLQESLRKYAGPREEKWGQYDKPVKVYFLDPLQFEQFKAWLDAGNTYSQTDSFTDNNRDWDRGVTFARWSVLPDGTFSLDLMKQNNSGVGYAYKKAP
jgi:hypothetical protein